MKTVGSSALSTPELDELDSINASAMRSINHVGENVDVMVATLDEERTRRSRERDILFTEAAVTVISRECPVYVDRQSYAYTS